jgi:hypothetical protein
MLDPPIRWGFTGDAAQIPPVITNYARAEHVKATNIEQPW